MGPATGPLGVKRGGAPRGAVAPGLLFDAALTAASTAGLARGGAPLAATRDSEDGACRVPSGSISPLTSIEYPSSSSPAPPFFAKEDRVRPLVMLSFLASSLLRLLLLLSLLLLLLLLRWVLFPLLLPEAGREPDPGLGRGIPEGAIATLDESTTRGTDPLLLTPLLGGLFISSASPAVFMLLPAGRGRAWVMVASDICGNGFLFFVDMAPVPSPAARGAGVIAGGRTDVGAALTLDKSSCKADLCFSGLIFLLRAAEPSISRAVSWRANGPEPWEKLPPAALMLVVLGMLSWVRGGGARPLNCPALLLPVPVPVPGRAPRVGAL